MDGKLTNGNGQKQWLTGQLGFSFSKRARCIKQRKGLASDEPLHSMWPSSSHGPTDGFVWCHEVLVCLGPVCDFDVYIWQRIISFHGTIKKTQKSSFFFLQMHDMNKRFKFDPPLVWPNLINKLSTPALSSKLFFFFLGSEHKFQAYALQICSQTTGFNCQLFTEDCWVT